jgi:transcription elongation factor Elf1
MSDPIRDEELGELVCGSCGSDALEITEYDAEEDLYRATCKSCAAQGWYRDDAETWK